MVQVVYALLSPADDSDAWYSLRTTDMAHNLSLSRCYLPVSLLFLDTELPQ